ncbi:hypothetical protein EDD17DRAFT_1165316 [Pisolithus thermaeus]|nr:hypothetical protein EDD17DRAFT_1165316 [Pisolithus thermaeus]
MIVFVFACVTESSCFCIWTSASSLLSGNAECLDFCSLAVRKALQTSVLTLLIGGIYRGTELKECQTPMIHISMLTFESIVYDTNCDQNERDVYSN